MNQILDYCKENPINNLDDICNEFILKKLILSIEPTFGEINLNQGSDYAIRYDNFSIIKKAIKKYLSLNPERVNFTSNADFSNSLNEDKLIKKDKEQGILLGEMLLFLSSISSNKDSYERLENCDENSLSLYINIIEKYSKKYESEDENDENNKEELTEEEKRLKEYLENERMKKELEEKKRMILDLQQKYEDIENKYNDCVLELANIKNNQETEFTAKEDLLDQRTINNSLRNEIKELRTTKETITNEYEAKVKNLNFKLKLADEKIISLESSLEKYISFKQENDKLKEKMKEYSSFYEIEKKLTEREIIIENKNEMISQLTKEKNKIQDNNISLIKEMQSLKEDINMRDNKNMILESKITKLEKELLDKNASSNEKPKKQKNKEGFQLSDVLGEDNENEEDEDYKQKYEDVAEELETYKNIVIPLTEAKEKLEEECNRQKEIIKQLGGESCLITKKDSVSDINEKDDSKEKEINALKQKISEQNNISEELRKMLDNREKESNEHKEKLNETTEQLDTYKNAVTLLTEEKDEYLNECQKLKETIKNLENNINISINKSTENSNNDSTNMISSELHNKEINELKQIISEKEGLIETLQGIIGGEKDINSLKNNGVDYKQKYNEANVKIEIYKNKINDYNKEKENYIKECSLLKENNKKLNDEITKYQNDLNKINENNSQMNKDIIKLKNENNDIKKLIKEKEDKILELNKNQNMNNNIIQDNKEVEEFKKKIDDLINENERIKANVTKEHELIASSMYELAIHFMKVEAQRQLEDMEYEGDNLSWIEIERRKNFPSDHYN